MKGTTRNSGSETESDKDFDKEDVEVVLSAKAGQEVEVEPGQEVEVKPRQEVEVEIGQEAKVEVGQDAKVEDANFRLKVYTKVAGKLCRSQNRNKITLREEIIYYIRQSSSRANQ